MPYIKPEDRAKFHLYADHGAEGIKLVADTPGELTYCLTVVVRAYLRLKGKSFGTICVIMGALFCAALEFYRRIAAPYEADKEWTNGDVY